MRTVVLLTTLLISGCSIDEDRFVTRLAEEDCTYALDCFDEPILNFYGWTDQETCESTHGPDLAAIAASCQDFDPKLARTCLKELGDRSCQGDGPGLDRPDACDAVFTSCEGAVTSGSDEVESEASDD